MKTAHSPPRRPSASLLECLHRPFQAENTVLIDNPFLIRYLEKVGAALEIPLSALEDLAHRPPGRHGSGQASTKPGIQLRWARILPFRTNGQLVLLQQTLALPAENEKSGGIQPLGIDIEGAGLRFIVNVNDKGAQIRGVISTLVHDEISVGDTPVDLNPELDPVEIQAVALASGLPAQSRGFSAEQTNTVRLRKYSGISVPGTDGSKLQTGWFYPVRTLRFRDPVPTEIKAWIPWRSHQDLNPIAVLLRTSRLTANAIKHGLVFEHDPFTATGDLSLRRNASAATLAAAQTKVTLSGLVPPSSGPWELKSAGVSVQGGDPISVSGETNAEPPTSNGDFFYSVRTNDFAAVNAYHHTQSMLELLDRFDLPLSSFAQVSTGTTSDVLQIIPRAAITPGPCHEGNCINAQAEIIPGSPQTLQMRFALADLQRSPAQPGSKVGEPLGIACDRRVVWHEFCHTLIAAATNYLEFPFVHSAGDALAAIMADPVSKLRDPVGQYQEQLRFVTFPWGTASTRRHDRSWSWTGPLGTDIGYATDIRDMSGYAREQVLSSTLFRYYRAIGGDSTIDQVRTAAAEYACFLIVAGIFLQGDAWIVPATNASGLLATMLFAEAASVIGPPPYEWVGGATNKVLAWAFAQQGLPPLHPTPRPDIFIANDTRNGDYAWTPEWRTGAEGIWNQSALGEQPDPGHTNHLYVRVANRAKVVAHQASVTVYVATAGHDRRFPAADWQMAILDPTIPPIQDQTAPTDTLVFGPFLWTPAAGQTYTVLAIAECPDDPSNTLSSSLLPCSYLPTQLERLVRCDNNLAARELTVP